MLGPIVEAYISPQTASQMWSNLKLFTSLGPLILAFWIVGPLLPLKAKTVTPSAPRSLLTDPIKSKWNYRWESEGLMGWRLEDGGYSTLHWVDMIIVISEMKQLNFCIQKKKKQNQSGWSIPLSECQVRLLFMSRIIQVWHLAVLPCRNCIPSSPFNLSVPCLRSRNCSVDETLPEVIEDLDPELAV